MTRAAHGIYIRPHGITGRQATVLDMKTGTMSDTGELLVELKKVGLRRGATWIVQNMDLRLARGEILTIIGPNGAGKSTTARIVAGIDTPDRGELWRRRELKIGYVPQKLSIDWTLPLTAIDFVRLAGRISRARAHQALERLSLARLAGLQFHRLSGGEAQRVMLARAIVNDPDLLVLDEPVAGLDVNAQIAFYEQIAGLRQQMHCAILMISHDLHVVMAATDRVICMNGHICCTGTPQQVIENPRFGELFDSQASHALAIYPHFHDRLHEGGERLPDA